MVANEIDHKDDYFTANSKLLAGRSKTYDSIFSLRSLEKEDKSTEDDANGRTSISDWIRIIFGCKRNNDDSLDTPPVTFCQLFRFASSCENRMVWVGIVFAIIVGAAQPLTMYLNGRIADLLIQYVSYEAADNADEFMTDSLKYAYISGSIGFVLIAFSFAQHYFLMFASMEISNTLRVKFIQSVLRQDAGYFNDRKFGAINAQLNSDGIGDKIGLLLRGIASFLTATLIAFFVNWRLTLAMCVAGPICALIMSSTARVVSYVSSRSQRATEEAGAVLQETLVNVRTVQASNGERTMVKKFSRRLTAGRRDAIIQYVAYGAFDGLFFCILYIFIGIGAYYGSTRVLAGDTTGGDVIIVTNLIILGAYYLGAMSPYIASVFEARVAAAVIYEQIDMVPERIDAYSMEGKALDRNSNCEITFDDVSFAYSLADGKKSEVLHQMSWRALPGESVALVGHSGCGKSTCISLMTRLYECDSGAVRVNGIDVKELSVQSLRRAIGIVSQEPVLFGGTIFENIALGDSTITIDQVEAACRIANAHNFIEKLEHGYNTKIGAGSVRLSGGQKQRIAIARALVDNPPILLLDEATSALDAESEILVQKALERASHGRTTVIIAHRLSTLRNADKIVVIDQGRVVESDTHAALVSRIDGIFAKFVKSQAFDNVDKNKDGVEDMSFDENNSSKDDSLRPMQEEAVNDESLLLVSDNTFSNLVETASKTSISRSQQKSCSLLSGSIGRVYCTNTGNYSRLFGAMLFSGLRGLELMLCGQILSQMFVSYTEFEADQAVPAFKTKTYFILGCSLAVGIFCFVTIFLGESLCGWTAERVVDALKLRSLQNILRQSGAFFDRSRCSSAELIKRITTDASALKAPLDFRFFNLVNNIVAVFSLIGVAFVFSWRVTAIGCVLMLLLFVMPTFLNLWIQKHNAKKQSDDVVSKVAVEIIENARTIQLLSKEKYFCRKYSESLMERRRPAIITTIVDGIVFALVQSFLFISDAACYIVGIFAVYYHLNEPNDVYVASMNLGMASFCVLFISTALADIIRAKPSADSIFELIDAVPNISSGTTQLVDKGNVDVESVDFAYPTRPHHLVADNLSLNVKRGECVALVGPSGGGKSTIISLLQRFYDPKSGSIQIDGVNIAQYSLRSLREQIALVEQEPVLFSGSIYDNVRLGVESTTTLEDVVKACEMANAKRFIESLPLGYQTEVGEKSSRLSGGQKQRIAIARALIRQPKILLLDEATSALDAQSEEAVRQALHTAQCQSACITIAHRLSSIQNADRVYFIRNGHVVESGTYRQLLADPRSQFAQMVAKQQLQ